MVCEASSEKENGLVGFGWLGGRFSHGRHVSALSRGSRLVEKRGSVGLRGSWFIVAWSWCVSRFLRVSGVGFCHDSVAQIGRGVWLPFRSHTADLTVCILGELLLFRYTYSSQVSSCSKLLKY